MPGAMRDHQGGPPGAALRVDAIVSSSFRVRSARRAPSSNWRITRACSAWSPPVISISREPHRILDHHPAALPAPRLEGGERGRRSSALRASSSASTIASSMPMQAPDARCGVVACTASPISTTRPLPPGPRQQQRFERADRRLRLLSGSAGADRLHDRRGNGVEQVRAAVGRKSVGSHMRSLPGRSSVTNRYISSRDTGLTPDLHLVAHPHRRASRFRAAAAAPRARRTGRCSAAPAPRGKSPRAPWSSARRRRRRDRSAAVAVAERDVAPRRPATSAT